MSEQTNKDGQIQIRTFNNIYQCTKCETWHNLKEAEPYCVNQMVGFQMMPTKIAAAPPQFVPVAQPAMLCPKCFKDLNMEDKQSDIVVPTMPLPKDFEIKRN